MVMKQKPTRTTPLQPCQQTACFACNTCQQTSTTANQPVKAECKDLYGSEALTFYFYYAQLLSASMVNTKAFLSEAL
jgi:hypothetical protein